MNAFCCIRASRPMVGVVAMGVLACSLSVYGAPRDQGSVAQKGYPSLTGLQYAPAVQAYSVPTVLDREGPGVGGVADSQGGCIADSHCDDCNPCTTDTCVVVFPAIFGTCTNEFIDQCSLCSDETFCDGDEICAVVEVTTGVYEAQCRPGLGDPCADDPLSICDELGGGFLLGSCEEPCATPADCDDHLECTGVETCVPQECVGGDFAGTPCVDNTPCTGVGGYCGGVCRSSGPPCGDETYCTEKRCNAPAPDQGEACDDDGDCVLNCLPAACIAVGRCCRDDGSGSYSPQSLACSRENKLDCLATGGVWLRGGDDPTTGFDEGSCTTLVPVGQVNTGEAFACPKYNAGIHDDADIASMAYIGQVGAAACNPITAIGDDYVLDIPLGEYLEVTTFRYIGGFDANAGGSRVRITFYDSSGNFIEDTITNGFANGATAARTIIFAEKPYIPATGYVVMTAANRFSPASKHHMMALGSVSDMITGQNDETVMWMNGAPVAASVVMTAVGADPATPGILAFEITGNADSPPLGACCQSTLGTCTNDLPWLCEQSGNYYQGLGTTCQACKNDVSVVCDLGGTDCPSCTGSKYCLNDPGVPCTADGECPSAGVDPQALCVQPACDPDAQCPGGLCSGGSCVGGSNDNGACDPDIDCAGAETCDVGLQEECVPVPPACTLQACCPGSEDPNDSCYTVQDGASCPVTATSLGFGTNCDPDWCPGTGGIGFDTCVEAGAPGNQHFFDVAAMTGCDDAETWTITGDNSNASFNDNVPAGVCDGGTCVGGTTPGEACSPDTDCPGGVCTDYACVGGTNDLGACDPNVDCPAADSCVGGIFLADGGTRDRGWWHSFSINACANVRMDFCGTAELFGEVKQPCWANLWNTCDPCTTTSVATAVGNRAEGGCVGTRESTGDRGSPFCAEDDLWETYGPLAAGDYWYPVNSSMNGTFGQYQLHFTVAPCAVAACCLPESYCLDDDDSLLLDGGNPVTCADNGVCNAIQVGSLCKSCAVLNQPDCDGVEGQWNGLAAIGADEQPNPSCIDACTYGSCCTGPGQCTDRNPSNPGVECDGQPSNCMTDALCTGTFVGSAECDNPAAPCPACTLRGDTNCQLPEEGLPGVYMSDLASPGYNGVVTADDFIPQSSTLTQVCTWGAYMDALAPNATIPWDCSSVNEPNEFRIRIFADDNGLPGAMLGESMVTGMSTEGGNIGMGTFAGSYLEALWGPQMFGYTLTLDDPITTMIPGEVNWIEIANNTDTATDVSTNNTCYWNWACSHLPDPVVGYVAGGVSTQTAPGQPLVGENSRLSTYVNGSAHGGTDMAFCLGGLTGPLSFETPAEPLAACWSCGENPGEPGACTVDSLGNCSLAVSVWNRLDPDCSLPMPMQPNDFCSPAECVVLPPEMAFMGPLSCGDGVLDPDEQCDDGNFVLGDGCDADCNIECVRPDVGGGAGAAPITDGLYALDTACAGLDGPDTSPSEEGNFSFDGDIWFAYTSTCTGDMLVDMCGSQSAYNRFGYTASDSALALYHEYETRCNGGSNDQQLCTCSGLNAKCIDTDQCPGTFVCNPLVDMCDQIGCSVEAIGMCQNQCPCPGPIVGISPLQDGIGSDEGCNGIHDAGAGYVGRTVFKDECWLIRSGSWLSAGGQVGTANRGRGLMAVSCSAADCMPSNPLEVQLAVGETGGQVPAYHSRFLSIVGGDAGQQQAIRVKFVSMPPPFEEWNGQSMWAGDPQQFNELPGKGNPCGTGADACTVATFWASTLQCEPFYRDWTIFADGDPDWDGAIHIMGEQLLPSRLLIPAGPIGVAADYDVQLIDLSCNTAVELQYGAALEMRTTGWCDIVALPTGGIPTNAGGKGIDVNDTLAMLQKFAGLPGNGGLPPKSWMDLVGVTTLQVPELDLVIDVNDLTSVLDAFTGNPPYFPFTPPGANLCP